MANTAEPIITIPVNKLGEYAYQTPSRKNGILKTLQSESTFKRAWYNTPKSAIIDVMLDDHHEAGAILTAAKKVIEKQVVTTDWAKNKRVCNLTAIEELKKCAGTVLAPFFEFQSQRGLPKDKGSIIINGVAVQLNPDIVLLSKKDQAIKGAIRLVFSKERVVERLEGRMIASLIKHHIEKQYGIKLLSSNVVVLDVFRQRVIPAAADYLPVAYTASKACAEIARSWPGVT